MNILVVEDDLKIAAFMSKGLKQAGYAVTHSADGQDAFTRATNGRFDLLIVDLMLPKLDGLSLIQELRKCGIGAPVIIVSAKRSVDDRVRGLQQGGDDYMTKPFAFAELLARIQAISRRTSGVSEANTLTVGPLSMDTQARQVTRDGNTVELTQREFALLEYLMRNAGKVVSKTMIAERVWNYSFDPQANVVEAHVCRLRDKIDRDASARLIHTIRGVGYVLRQKT